MYDQCEANFLQKCELELEKIKQIENLEKQSNSPEIVPSSVTQIKKIIWKGTQKQLAELFIELKKKGWIDHHENGAIKSCFAETKSIDQYLKPFHDPKSKVKEPTYENVYTTEYIPSFDSVTPNKGS